MKLRQAIPPAIIGAIITFVIMGIGFIALQEVLVGITQGAAMSQASLNAEMEMVIIMFFGLILAGMASGGFAAAYLSTRNLKERLEASVLTSGLSGVLSSMGCGALVLIMSPESFVALPPAIAISAGIATIGGTANALLLGAGKSPLSKAFGKAVHDVTQRPIVYLAPLVFLGIMTLISYALEGVVLADSNAMLAIEIGIALAALLLMSFALTGIVKAAKGKQHMMQLLKESVTSSKSVVLGFIILSVPMALVGAGALLLLMSSDLSVIMFLFSPLGAILATLVLTTIMLVLLGFGFLPQAAVLGKHANAIGALKKSFAFVRKNAAGVFSLYALIIAAVIVIQVIVMVLELMVSLAVDITIILPGLEFVLSIALITLAVSAQTHYYIEMK